LTSVFFKKCNFVGIALFKIANGLRRRIDLKVYAKTDENRIGGNLAHHRHPYSCIWNCRVELGCGRDIGDERVCS